MTGGGGRAISTVWAVDGVLWGCARVSRANRVDPGSEVCSSLLRDRGSRLDTHQYQVRESEVRDDRGRRAGDLDGLGRGWACCEAVHTSVAPTGSILGVKCVLPYCAIEGASLHSPIPSA